VRLSLFLTQLFVDRVQLIYWHSDTFEDILANISVCGLRVVQVGVIYPQLGFFGTYELLVSFGSESIDIDKYHDPYWLDDWSTTSGRYG